MAVKMWETFIWKFLWFKAHDDLGHSGWWCFQEMAPQEKCVGNTELEQIPIIKIG